MVSKLKKLIKSKIIIKIVVEERKRKVSYRMHEEPNNRALTFDRGRVAPKKF
jgi:hypothetical protein